MHWKTAFDSNDPIASPPTHKRQKSDSEVELDSKLEEGSPASTSLCNQPEPTTSTNKEDKQKENNNSNAPLVKTPSPPKPKKMKQEPHHGGSMFCRYCRSSVCIAEEKANAAVQWYLDTDSGVTFSQMSPKERSSVRKQIYREYVRTEFGPLGPGVRREIPMCVVTAIRAFFPSSDGKYMGFRDS